MRPTRRLVPELQRHQQQLGGRDQLGDIAGAEPAVGLPGLGVRPQGRAEPGQALVDGPEPGLVGARAGVARAAMAHLEPDRRQPPRPWSSLVARRHSRAAGPAGLGSAMATLRAAASTTTARPVSQCCPGWRERYMASIGKAVRVSNTSSHHRSQSAKAAATP